MGQIISEGLEFIGSIDDSGYVFDKAGDAVAYVAESGYISDIGGCKIYGRISETGNILDSMSNVVGRIQANGDVVIHGERVCRVSSSFLESITPKAWNAGQPSSYSGRKTASVSEVDDLYDESPSFFESPFFIKLVIGIILGIILAITEGDVAMFLCGPVIVFIVSFFARIFG